MKDKVAKVYDHMAPVYYFVFGFSLEGARRKAIELAQIQENEKVLEVGVGTGLTFRHMPQNIDFTGIDLSEKMLAQAQSRSDLLKKKYKLLKMNAAKLEFENESFDVIVSAHFLSATSNPIPALLEMKRVLKKTGRILLVNNFQNDTALKFVFEPMARLLGFSVKLDLNYLVQQSGLQISKIEAVSTLLPINGVILKKG